MSWTVVYIKEAHEDLKKLDNSQRLHTLAAIEKVATNPLPQNEGGFGKPLGNKHNTNLTGYYKIKLLSIGIRVVYRLVRENMEMKIIVVSVREDETVYKIANQRIK